MLGNLGQVLPMLDGVWLLGVILQAANHIHDVLILKHYLKKHKYSVLMTTFT